MKLPPASAALVLVALYHAQKLAKLAKPERDAKKPPPASQPAEDAA